MNIGAPCSSLPSPGPLSISPASETDPKNRRSWSDSPSPHDVDPRTHTSTLIYEGRGLRAGVKVGVRPLPVWVQ